MPRAGLTRSGVASAALELIDRDGLDTFTMRKLGAHLGVTPMAVYRHVRDQEELFDGIAETIFDQIDVDGLPWQEGWRTIAEEYCFRLRDALADHPHAVTIFATRPIRSASAIDVGSRMIERFTSNGLSGAHALRILRTLRELTVGHAISIAAVQLGSTARSRKPEPHEPEYNALAEAADATAIDDHFAVGLTALLDGFEHGDDVGSVPAPRPKKEAP